MHAVAATHVAQAEWQACGVQISPLDNHDHVAPRILSDGGSGTIIVWDDRRNGLPLPQPFALRLDSDGNIVDPWTAGGVSLCDTTGTHYLSGAISDGQGGAIVVWQDDRIGPGYFDSYDVYAQKVTSAGAIATGWPKQGFPVCAAPGQQYPSDLVSDGNGGAFFFWYDQRAGSESRVYANHVLASGVLAPGWTQDGMPLSGR